MNELQIFNHPQFGSIRVVEIDGEPWMVGKDVATALGYAKPENAIAVHVDTEDKTTTLIQGTGSNYKSKAVVINESGFYSLVLSSKLPGAKKLHRWVTSEVLPSIRRHGVYMTPEAIEEVLSDPDTIIQMATTLKKERQRRAELEAQAAADRPKVLFADAVSVSNSSILVGELAKILKQNGVENMGQNRLFGWMRSNGYLVRRKGTDYNMPTQRAMELGLFEIKETVVSHSDGHTSVSKTPKVTGKGQLYFVEKFLGEKGETPQQEEAGK